MITPFRAATIFALSIGLAAAGAAQSLEAQSLEARAQPASPEIAAWSAQAQHSIARQMVFPRRYGRADYGREFVGITFRVGLDGVPADIEVTETSRNPWTDRAAVAAVRRVGSLAPLPAAFGNGQRLGALLVFPRSSEPAAETRRRIEAVRQTAVASIGSRHPGSASAMPVMLVAAAR